MFRRKPRFPRPLERVAQGLEAVSHERSADEIDLAPIRRAVARYIDRLAPERLRGDIETTLMEFVDLHLHDWRRVREQRHHARLRRLDLLEAEVLKYLAGHGALSEEFDDRINEAAGLVDHIHDRVGEPDAPFIDPIR